MTQETAALALYEKGDLDGAARAFTELLKSETGNITALEYLAFYTSQRGEFSAARDWYERLVTAQPANAGHHYNLAMAAFALEEWPAALQSLGAALGCDPHLIQAQLYRGVVLDKLGNREAAARAYLAAVRYADRQLDPRTLPNELKAFLNHANTYALQFLDDEIEIALRPLRERHGADSVQRLRAAADIFLGRRPANFAHPKWRPGLFYVPDLPPKPWHDRSDFPWAAQVEAATAIIRDELLEALQAGEGFAPYVNHPEGSHEARVWQAVNRSMDWSSLHLYRHGVRVEENCARCPRTVEILEKADLHRVPGHGPEVMFSVLKPKAKIPPHYGSVNGRLIVHLPLIVPPNCGALKVAGEARSWVEGELLFFDDSFEHEAWNDSDQTRVVLIFDTWNPHLTMVEREAFSAVLSAAQRFERG